LWVWGAGLAALVGGYIYLRNKGQAAGTPAAAPASTAASSSPTGMSWDQFLLFLHDQQSSSSTATTTTSGPPPAPGGGKPKPKLYWSGALGRWMTGAQWHQWHIQHLAHVKKTGG
jgi:hypothetical protein